MREREEPSAKALDVVLGDDSIFVHLWVHSLPTYLLTEQVSCFDAAFVHDISEIPRFIFPFDVDNQRPQLDCRLPNRTEPNRHFFHDFTFCMPLFGPSEDLHDYVLLLITYLTTTTYTASAPPFGTSSTPDLDGGGGVEEVEEDGDGKCEE
jgi:hypothetical protein